MKAWVWLSSVVVGVALVRVIGINPALAQTPATQPAQIFAATPPAATNPTTTNPTTTNPTTTNPTTTNPASQDEPPTNAPMRRWFDRLADPNPKVRDQARVDLMGLGLNDLPGLRQLIIDHQPLVAPQAAVMHDIVIQMFLRDEKYEVNGAVTTIAGDQSPFFLGIRWERQFERDAEPRFGVPFDMRLPGFPGFRYLHPDDMILGVFIDPSLPLDQVPNSETHTPAELINTVRAASNVQDVVLEVLRDGERERIPVKMAPRPAKVTDSSDEFNAERMGRAEAFWREKFAPLLDRRYVGDPLEGPPAP